MPERPTYQCSCGRPRQVVTALRSGTTWLFCGHCDRPCTVEQRTGFRCNHCFDLNHAGAK